MKALCASALSVLAPLISVGAADNPNIILIMADDMGWGDVGFNGNTTIRTPHLDTLASQGVVFDRFYAASALSSPTRAGVLTGRNPFRTGVFSANVGILRTEEVTLPELLLQRGYATGHFGKWHLGSLTYTENDANRGRTGNINPYNPPALHGYIESFVTESKVPTYDPMIRPEECDNRFWDHSKEGDSTRPYGTAYWRHDGTKESLNLDGDDSRVIMDRVIPFIDKSMKEKRPFFSVVWFHTPHLPCVAGPEHAALYGDLSVEERNYYGCITAMDEQIGRLMAHLKESGVYDNTIICFCSDNGPEIATPGTAMELRGRKRDLFEGGIRVPGIISYPKMVESGRRTDHIASVYDYMPTMVDLLGLPAPAHTLDGESLMPFLRDGAARTKPLIYALGLHGTVIEQQYKLVYNKGQYLLFDISRDPAERNNIAGSHPEIVKRMSAALDEAMEQYRRSFEGEEYGRFSADRMNQKWRGIKNN